jgi:hypothetical protein
MKLRIWSNISTTLYCIHRKQVVIGKVHMLLMLEDDSRGSGETNEKVRRHFFGGEKYEKRIQKFAFVVNESDANTRESVVMVTESRRLSALIGFFVTKHRRKVKANN